MACRDLKTIPILFLILFLPINHIETSGSDFQASFTEVEELSKANGLTVDLPFSKPDEKMGTIVHTISDGTLYFGAGIVFGSASLLAKLGWAISLVSPWDSTIGNGCLLLSHLCSSAAHHSFGRILKSSSSTANSDFFKEIPASEYSWRLNQMLLSQVPVSSDKEQKLLLFLEKRWLAKSTGFFPALVNWVCPCFGISVQVHPETTSSYARDPSIKLSQTYKNVMEEWKQTLPHPQHFPLILTRPFDIQNYLPACLDVPQHEKIEKTVQRLLLKTQKTGAKAIIDLTRVLSDNIKTWEAYQLELSQACKEHNLDLNQIVCIQRVQKEEIGGIRLLPLTSIKETDLHYQFLLEWISRFGLSATRIELDRWPLPSNIPIQKHKTPPISIPFQSKEAFISYLNSFDQTWNSSHPQKTLMLKGTLQLFRGLFAALSEKKWDEIINCPTRSSVVQISFSKVKAQLKLLAQEKNETLFFDTASRIEQIHADLSALLEIFSPFTSADFPSIYQNLLTSIPPRLKPLTSCVLHSSGMTSIGGVLKAVEKTLGAPPRVFYGENSYFECISAAKLISNVSSISDATEEDWKEVDLIIAQFNPALKRIDLPPTEYRVEKIAEVLHKSFKARQGKPLTLALDSTFDFIDSPRIGKLAEEFQKEIEDGILNIISYRSGLKFDLFGMDNYCGAPFYMIHNQDAKWASFDSLLTDPALQTDTLSSNWFCLAYQSAAPQLEQYRKQIFDNTRALLNKVPSRLFNKKETAYRIVPFEQGADPAFLDIKISGPLHQIKSAALAGGCLYIKCMEGGHPIFYRPSVGFYHPNFTMLFSEDYSTIRLTLGLDPAQIDVLAKCFEMIDTLNGSSWQILPSKLGLLNRP